jgi:hypothetical protein
MTWAVSHKLPLKEKMVLLMLANRTNPDSGRCTPSHERLAEDCGMSVSSVQRAIQQLEEWRLLNVVPMSIGGIKRPNSYMLLIDRSTGPIDTSNDPVLDRSGGPIKQRELQTENKDSLTLSELNLPPAQVPESHETFERFWSLWPRSERKVAKDKCLRYWRRSCLFKQAKEIFQHVEVMKGSKSWQEGFIPQPYTYLNQRRWEAEADEQQTNIFKGVK